MANTELSVQYGRSHTQARYHFSNRVTAILGPNGSGKTTLLEAIHIALRGTSFRGSDSEFLQRGADWWRVDLRRPNDVRSVTYQPDLPARKKRFIINNATHYRLPLAKKYPVVVFVPDDLRVLHGSPARRRAFIDTIIAQSNPSYPPLLRRYERALKQRNNLLKQPLTTYDDVFIWDVALAEYGAAIAHARAHQLAQMNTTLGPTYRSIAGRDDDVTIHYDAPAHTSKQALMNQLHAQFTRDKLLGYTTSGPHRHDMACDFNGAPARAVASRGEVRSIILALKFIEVDTATQATGQPPVILLDDVFAELDESRQQRLAEKCQHGQMFITSTTGYGALAAEAVIQLAD